ncbi:MAG: tRNA modification GTPase, partial [Sphingomonadales bacterium]|nr:tRNA modification GTPase [Sphingomonadales bacterium]
MNDTIFALSSGSPPAAIAVVRVSGPRASAALAALAGSLPEPRVATLAGLRWRGKRLDRALVLRFPGPDSVTGEDVAELHLHGGRAVVAAVLEALAGLDGLRSAEPGEFTRRAFENGRIDLAEAEGLADLLAAETQSQRRTALAAAGGALSRQVEAWRQRLLALAAALEAALDFSDEGEVGEAWPPGWGDGLAALAAEIAEMLARPPAERLQDGLRVVIAGPPNAGKSSLLNALAQRDAAITSAVPGTTRDLVEAPTAIGGTPFLLIDTAGLRDSDDEVESLGVTRARSSLEAADLILWLGDPAEVPDRGRSILIRSKCDLAAGAGEADVRVS